MSVKNQMQQIKRAMEQIQASIDAKNLGFRGPFIAPVIDGKLDTSGIDAYITTWNLSEADSIIILPELCADTEGLDGLIAGYDPVDQDGSVPGN